jgi:hypothetical protein
LFLSLVGLLQFLRRNPPSQKPSTRARWHLQLGPVNFWFAFSLEACAKTETGCSCLKPGICTCDKSRDKNEPISCKRNGFHEGWPSSPAIAPSRRPVMVG